MTKIFILLTALLWASTSFGATLCSENFNSYATGHMLAGSYACSNGTSNFIADHGDIGGGSTGENYMVAGAGPDGTNALQVQFKANELNRYFDYIIPPGNSDIWVKTSFKFDCGSGSCIGGAKFLKIHGVKLTDTNYADSTFQNIWESGIFAGILYGNSGDTRDTQLYIYLTGGNKDPRDGTWHTVKYHMKYNTNGQSNGAFELWYDGTKLINSTAVNNRSDNNSTSLWKVGLGGWNQSYAGIPYNIYYDNVVIATTDPDIGGGDTTPPTINSFTLAATSTSLTVPITAFTASDNVGVTNYCVTPTNNSSTCTWTYPAPTYYVFGSVGTQTLYAFVRDAAANTSTVASSSTTITLNADTTAPTIPTAFRAVSTSSTDVLLNWTASSDNVGVAGYLVHNATLNHYWMTAGTSTTDLGLATNTSYVYTVQAYDAAGNYSATATTGAVLTTSYGVLPANVGGSGKFNFKFR